MRGLSLTSSLLVDIGVYFGEAAQSISVGFFGLDSSRTADFRELNRGLEVTVEVTEVTDGGAPMGEFIEAPLSSSCELVTGLLLSASLADFLVYLEVILSFTGTEVVTSRKLRAAVVSRELSFFPLGKVADFRGLPRGLGTADVRGAAIDDPTSSSS